ncbi:DUF885 family protein [Sphingomonas sp. GM_Shp_2]|uniref:DUF885 domain-containing protein n=1 Tax=Sphingomonas sp. GM_Shp_2 TaxID=2937380 RepID=UPI00226AB335|nr:DUF885 family protein [Sphingomonas sp. GM_Shp_2]
MNRRNFIGATTAASAFALAPRAVAQAAPGDARLTAAFDTILATTLQESPELATSLGFDKGANAGLKSKLDDNSLAGRRRSLARAQVAERELRAIQPDSLSPQGRIDRDVVLYSIEQQQVGPARFDIDAPTQPYRITQQRGVYFDLPDFLDSTHTVANAADADAYIARLDQMGTALDNDTAVQAAEAERGLVAPDFSLDLALGQMMKLRQPQPAANTLVDSIRRRTAEANIAGDHAAEAAEIVRAKVYPALDRQIALVRKLRAGARKDAGLWAVPQGEAIYAAALAAATTTTLSPSEVHQMGLEQVADLTSQLDAILKQQGLTKGSVGARLAALNATPAQLYPDTPAGRTALIAGLNDSVRAMQAKLPQAFTNAPDAPLEIKAVPAAIQDGASNGYYYRAPLDGSRPAIYWINLKSVADWPKYTLPSLTYHEGVPGHHLQISTAQRADTHVLRKISFFGAYLEGWALYAEQLADELGGYAGPIERAGYLQSFLFRAARLVADTGIHTKRWTREQGTQYFVDTVGFARPRSQREIERYCTMPGQACSYKIGHASWLRARAKAQEILGDRFDLKQFHDILEAGAVPLTMLEQLTEARARALKG